MIEYLPRVDEFGNVTGKVLRSECHGNPSIIHPVVHLHVTDGSGRLLLQRRSDLKDLLPGYWDTAVGGHIAYGEETRQALERETGEELGISARSAKFLYSYCWRSRVETEFVSTFIMENQGPFQIDPLEVAETRFFTKEEIIEKIGRGILTPNFEDEWRRLAENGAF
jgi:isopentenyldiphosphate isomerase